MNMVLAASIWEAVWLPDNVPCSCRCLHECEGHMQPIVPCTVRAGLTGVMKPDHLLLKLRGRMPTLY